MNVFDKPGYYRWDYSDGGEDAKCGAGTVDKLEVFPPKKDGSRQVCILFTVPKGKSCHDVLRIAPPPAPSSATTSLPNTERVFNLDEL